MGIYLKRCLWAAIFSVLLLLNVESIGEETGAAAGAGF
jgi:hypothetical protein